MAAVKILATNALLAHNFLSSVLWKTSAHFAVNAASVPQST
jgi:hypothetical protein